MTRMNVLADALNCISNAEKKGKRQVMLRPASKVLIKFLSVMMKHGYIGEFEMIDDHRSNKIVVNLTGRLNKGKTSQGLWCRLRLTALDKWDSFVMWLLSLSDLVNNGINQYLAIHHQVFVYADILFGSDINASIQLSKCGVISPRFDVSIRDMERWTTNLLPSRQFGYIVLTTSGGIMDHEEARKKHLGGKILGFFF